MQMVQAKYTFIHLQIVAKIINNNIIFKFECENKFRFNN